MSRLSFEEARLVCEGLKETEVFLPYDYDRNWYRTAETENYSFEFNCISLDYRIMDKRTNKEVWSYYADYRNVEI